MTVFNAFSYIPVMKTDFILKTSLDKELCDKLISITKDKVVDDIPDNLKNVKRTPWQLHTDEDVAPYINKVVEKVNHCVRTRLNYPHPNQDNPSYFENKMFYYSFATFNAWVAFYEDSSFVEPHCHTEYPSFYSSSAYLSTGDKETTSLSFLSDESPSFNENKLEVTVKEGDMLIFPSNMIHWTDDAYKGRVILSCNCFAGFSPNLMNKGIPKKEDTNGET